MEMTLVNMREGGMISAHDYRVSRAVAVALCGGEVEYGSLVDEAWLLAVERREFIELLKTPETRRASSTCSKPANPCVTETVDNKMERQIQDAYIVAATRTPVARRKGMFRNVRPDDLLAHVLKSVMAQAPGLDPALIGDVIVGCAMPEAEQGMNVARIGVLLAGLPNTVPGITINRFCSSGLQAVADAASQIRSATPT
jgi:F0F1-type ATP synthase membrane subunit c/vacuolar-type H+-ATPase subunit K